jgi:hypothetical protein
MLRSSHTRKFLMTRARTRVGVAREYEPRLRRFRSSGRWGVDLEGATIDSEEDGIRKLEQLAKDQSNEFRLIHRPTLAILATRNGPKSASVE